jgi:L-threonylcarbamoyladenylate synthase
MQVNLAQAIVKLKNGEVVAIPTETVYGLAADATNDAALRQIYAIKQRPMDNPLIVHIADANQVNNWATEFSPLAQKLSSAFWPGPFTLVLPAKPHVSLIVRGDQPTVALRVPAHPLALQLLKESGLALAAPSANKFTNLSPTTAAHVTAGLGEDIAVLDGGACEVGIESTIVSVQGDNWQLLRLGMISEADIERVAGKAAMQCSLPIKAPGQHHLHYSPRTPMRLFTSRDELLKNANARSAALLLGSGAVPNCTIFHSIIMRQMLRSNCTIRCTKWTRLVRKYY